ncbi:MAG: tetratricopeptide repeat protein [Acidobacteria bacterium]|nr:tetratricopeptide repeat protein [Acidobacteriota bacterium]
MSRTFILLFVIFNLCLSVSAQVAHERQTLVPGQPVEREIAGGESHTYRIALQAGQFMRVVFEQKAVDVALALAAPNGKQVAEINLTGVGGLESLSAEAVASGDYRLTVRAVEAAALAGSYQVRLEVKAAATAQDKQRMSAERLLNEAGKSNQEGAAAVEPTVEKARQALALWRELGDRYWEGTALHLIGIAYFSAKKYEQAIEASNQALEIRREVKDRAGEASTLSNLGRANLRLNRGEKAIEYYEQALDIWREMKDRAGEASTLKNMGNAYIELGRSEKAIESLGQSLVYFREVKNRAMESNALFNLGFACLNLSRPEKAIEYLEQALAIHREMKNRGAEAYVLSVLGGAHSRLSRYEKAIEYYEQALAIAREVNSPAAEASALSNAGVASPRPAARSGDAGAAEGKALFKLGEAYNRLGRPEKAIEYLEQALVVHREWKNRLSEGSATSELGLAYANLGRPEKAIEYYEQALAIAREVKFRESEGSALNNLGQAYANLNRNEKAIEYYEQALAIAREVKFRGNERDALDNLGQAYNSQGRPEKAIEYYEQALVISREIHARDMEAGTLYHLASAERARGNLPAARTHVEQSLTIAESLRSDELTSPELRASFLTGIQSSYQLYTDLLMRQHREEPTKGFAALALEVSERQRARSLLDLLSEARADVRQGVDAALIERERTLAKQLNDKAQTRASTPEQAAALKREVSQLETDLERAQVAIRNANPHYAALTKPQPLKLKEIQAQLDADTLLLEYALGEERSYLWAITRDSLASYELPKGEQIKQSALQVYELLTARSTRARGESPQQGQERISQAEAKLPAAAQALSQTLLAPVAAQLGNKRLVIVADGALQYIPFAMLPEPTKGSQGDVETARAANPQSAGSNPQSPVPLIVGHEVVSLPSASALAIQRAELAGRQPAPKLLAVIADPVFDRTDERFKTVATDAGDKTQTQTIAYADARSIEHLAEQADDKAGTTIHRLVIPRLPFTHEEATRLLALAPKTASFGAIDFRASRATVLSGDLSQYRYVHFATHGLLDSERPGLSALVLSMVDAEGKAQDGFLRANDIYNLKLPAELVVLSACQTGLGKEIKGEGLVGLTRGFMYAGAARVVVSLWSVNDKATADLMTKFYEKMLKQGVRPAAALRAAQVEMWRQKQWQSPYYWAAFTMQGEWR